MRQFRVVALVCSAGGLQALTTVLAGLPASLPAAVIALQHQSPDHVTNLPALLDRQTALPVMAASDGARLEPGHVLVAPAGRHTLIRDNLSIVLIPSGPLPPYRPSADLLLTTLALAAGPRTIAVVLTGRGNDAATGATAVHKLGGTVIASSLDTSTQPAMPQATIDRDGIIDHVVPLETVGHLLIALITA
jgi:two-component system, chemotaxis family, protein-glutamate methylesterase/glutaminase